MSHVCSYRSAAAAAAFGVALLGASPVAHAAEGRFERTLQVNGAVTLSVMTGSGRISIQPGADGQVRIVATMKTSDGWGGSRPDGMTPEAAIAAIVANPPVEQQGNVIRVGDLKDRPEGKNVSISYELVVPRQTSLTSSSGSGSQVIGDLAGPVNASTGSGSLELGRISGDTKASAGSGSIVVAGTTGKTDASTGSGRIELRAADGPVAARTGSGEIVIGNLGRGDVQASSGSGSITVNLPAAASFVLDASSSSGRIESDFQVTTTETSRRTLKGTVGSGGPVVRASSGSGSIHVVKAAR